MISASEVRATLDRAIEKNTQDALISVETLIRQSAASGKAGCLFRCDYTYRRGEVLDALAKASYTVEVVDCGDIRIGW